MGYLELRRPAGLSGEAWRLFDDLVQRMDDWSYAPEERDIPAIAAAAEAIAAERAPNLSPEEREKARRLSGERVRELWRDPSKRRAMEVEGG